MDLKDGDDAVIDFDEKRWAHVRARHEGWWAGRNTSPLVGIAIQRPGEEMPMPLTQANCHDLSKSAEQVAGEIEAWLGSHEYLGDAYPYYNMACFGPGVLAAMLGARLDNATGRVWFKPGEVKDIARLHFSYDPDSPWLCRVRDIYRACVRRFGGRAVVSMVDLGGILDVLSTFRPSELLMYDLYDHPREVARLVSELEEVWHQVYRDLAQALESDTYGYTDWSSILSSRPSYITQCDFCYMIGPEMFRAFVLDTLRGDCERLERVIYHLDGPGQLRHTKMLLEIEKLACVQWVPGAGNPDCAHYPQLYREILAAGKRINLNAGDLDVIGTVCEQTGNPGAISRRQYAVPAAQRENTLEGLRKLGVI